MSVVKAKRIKTSNLCEQSNFYVSLSNKDYISLCLFNFVINQEYFHATNFLCCYLPSRVEIVLQANNFYIVRDGVELACKDHLNSTESSLAIVPYKENHSNTCVLNESNFLLKGMSLELPIDIEVPSILEVACIDFVFGN